MIGDAHQRWTLRVVCVSTALLLLNVAAPQVALAAIADSLTRASPICSGS